MTRTASSPVERRRHKKILKRAKGFRARSHKVFRAAVQRVEKALQYAYRDRRQRKRDMRSLWIARINAASRFHALPYGRFMEGLRRAGVDVDRKILADIAVRDPQAFGVLAQRSRTALEDNYSPSPDYSPGSSSDGSSSDDSQAPQSHYSHAPPYVLSAIPLSARTHTPPPPAPAHTHTPSNASPDTKTSSVTAQN